MLKEILIKTAELINRDDIISELKSETPGNSISINSDIYRLISYYNYIIEILCDNYFNIQQTQSIYSDKNRKINLLNFNYEPTKITCVYKNNRPVFFSEYTKFITVPEANTCYEVTYTYLPDRVTELTSEVELPLGVTQRIVCYGIASEFLASKGNKAQAEYWNNKFMFEIFKSKTTKDRKIKQTFSLWKEVYTIQISNIIQ